MMTLQQLLPDVTLPASAAGVVLSGLQLDSRNVAPGDLFLAVPGVASDGRQFVSQAIAAGAVAVLADAETFEIQQDQAVPCVALPGLGRRVGALAARWYGEQIGRAHV